VPQFDFARNFLPQVFWLAIVFAFLYFVIVRATLPRLGKVMQDREDTVLGDLDSAQAAKAEADSVSEAYETTVRKAQEEARAMIASSRSAAQKGVEARLHEVDAGIAAKADVAQAALEAARSKAADEIQAIAADAAGSIVERLTGVRPADDKVDAAAKAALAKA
jgi:F-type H+-transporting ATPase subunit b